MNSQMTDTAILEALHALQASMLAQQSHMQAQQASLQAMQMSMNAQQESIQNLRSDVSGLKVKVDLLYQFYAKKEDVMAVEVKVESLRGEIYKAVEAQTWKIFTWLTILGSSLTAAVYYIARNVH